MEGSRLCALVPSRVPSTACLLCPSPWPGTGASETDTLNCRKASSQQAASRTERPGGVAVSLTHVAQFPRQLEKKKYSDYPEPAHLVRKPL